MRHIGAIAAALLLGACEAKIGDPADAGRDEAASVDAAGKAEDGQISIDAPGFDLKLKLPASIAANAEMDESKTLLFPGSTVAGVHIQASKGGAGKPEGAVEIRFDAPAPPAQVLAWYRDAARAADFTIAAVKQEGSASMISANQIAEGAPFTVRLAPGQGGTDGRLVLTDRS